VGGLKVDSNRWRRIKNIYQQALDFEKSDRRAFVASACGDDESLAAEVMKLLDVPTQGSSDIDEIVDSAAESFSGALTPGDRVGAYRILDAIGTGGMGYVYLAERADTEFEQRVAIKTVNLGFASPSMLERFQLERQILANLEHNHIARLLDGGRTESGVPYLVMEFIDGKSIVDYCEDEGLSLDRRLDLLLQICDAVQYAHRKLIVHRDIKPSNILVTADGIPKLLDFGVAKLLDASGDNALTRAEGRILTPEYASPEQILGEPVTTSTDVYGLGILLYELLSGRKPFDLGRATSPEIRELICRTDPVEPSKAAADIGNGVKAGRISGDLDRITMKAIRKEPERRYEDVRDLAQDIRNFRAGRPVSARAPSWTYRTGKFVQRNRTAVVAIGAAALAAIILTAYYTIRLASERDVALRERQTADAATEFMTDLFAESEPGNALGESLTAREILDRGAEKLDQELDQAPRVRARLLYSLGYIYESLGDYDSAQRFVEESVSIMRSDEQTDRMNLIESLEELSWIYYRREDWESARVAAEEALAMRETDFGPYHASSSRVLNILGTIWFWLDDIDTALDYYHRALAINERNDDLLAQTMTMNNLAITYQHIGDLASAGDFYRRSLAVRLKQHEPNHPRVGTAHGNLASHYVETREWDKAIEHATAALEINRSTRGEYHSDVAFVLGLLASAYSGLGEQVTAERYAREAVELWATSVGRQHSRYAEAKTKLVRILRLQEKYEDALPHAVDALEIMIAANGPDHSYTADALSSKARLLYALGRTNEARPLAENAARIRRDKLGRGHYAYWDSEMLLAQIEIEDGAAAEATGRLETLLLDAESSEKPDEERIVDIRTLLDDARKATTYPDER
jgi:serine/threonine protein kinase/lipopolysaccharide biosynthesis regulator YciM